MGKRKSDKERFTKEVLRDALEEIKNNKTSLGKLLGQHALKDARIAESLFKVLNTYDRTEQENLLEGFDLDDITLLPKGVKDIREVKPQKEAEVPEEEELDEHKS